MMLNPKLIVMFAVFGLFIASSDAQTPCYLNALCGPMTSLVEQGEAFTSAQGCINQCSGQSYHYASYVSSAELCFCTATCNSQIESIGTNSYCLTSNPAPTAHPTSPPTKIPSSKPVQTPTQAPSFTPIPISPPPTKNPTLNPTATAIPTTFKPSSNPTSLRGPPSVAPTCAPTTKIPTPVPTIRAPPSVAPTCAPTTKIPTPVPTMTATSTSPIGSSNYGTTLFLNPTVQIYIPPQACGFENCASSLGSCNEAHTACTYKNGYNGLQTFPEAYITHYCSLPTGACNGVLGLNPPYTSLDIANAVAQNRGLSLCSETKSAPCVGIAAVPPLMMGNSQSNENRNSIPWGSGLSVASGNCYRLTSGQNSVYVAITDRCGGYCSCSSNSYAIAECGPCVNDPTLTPNCQCRGSIGSTIAQCSSVQQCDWCSANDHPHFDLDDDTFNAVGGSTAGSLQLDSVTLIPNCLDVGLYSGYSTL